MWDWGPRLGVECSHSLILFRDFSNSLPWPDGQLPLEHARGVLSGKMPCHPSFCELCSSNEGWILGACLPRVKPSTRSE
jgi:hypothetical protein